MTNRSKQKGTRAETKVVNYLVSRGIPAERRALHGCKDEGDIIVQADKMTLILEIKAGQQTSSPNRTQITEWMEQTKVESKNSGYPAALVVVRFRRVLIDAEVYYYNPFSNAWEFYYLDEFFDKF